MEHPEWIATIIGALLCLVFSWFLAVVSRSQGVAFGKVGPAIGMAGASVLAGMAFVGPSHVSQSERRVSVYTSEGYPRVSQGVFHLSKLLSVVSRTHQEIGQSPSKNHIAYEHPDGKLEWVTKSEYAQLIRHQAKLERKRAKLAKKGNEQ